MKNYAFLTIITLMLAGVSCKKDITGCTDPKAMNYEAEATKSDSSSCKYPAGYGPGGILDPGSNGSGADTVIQGCMDPDGENYNPDATIPGFCVIRGCGDENASNYNPKVTVNVDDSCTTRGCTDPKSWNYNPNANEDDGSCINQREPYTGDWDISGDCRVPFVLSNPQSISYNAQFEDTIVFDPFYFGNSAFGIVDFEDLTIPQQTVGNATMDGRGTIDTTTNTITINYNYTVSIPIIGTRSGSCTATYTKR